MKEKIIKANTNGHPTFIYTATKNCIEYAIFKQGYNRETILKEIAQDKAIENKVMDLHEKGIPEWEIASKMGMTRAEVIHIIKFDNLGLSYRKVGRKKNAA